MIDEYCRESQWRAQETTYQWEQRLAMQREHERELQGRETPEQREQRLVRRREWDREHRARRTGAEETPEQREQRLTSLPGQPIAQLHSGPNAEDQCIPLPPL